MPGGYVETGRPAELVDADPAFSVVIPTLGRAHLLHEAVSSVANQSYPALEIIVVADGPQSELPTPVAHPGFRFISIPKGGVARARNHGARVAKGEWLAFLDDDDLWRPDHLRILADYIRANPRCNALQAGYWTFSEGPVADLQASNLDGCLDAITEKSTWTDMSYIHIRGRSYDRLLERNRGVISTSKVRRSTFLESGGFPDGESCAEDWIMHLNVARLTEWHSIPDRLSFVRIHDGNNTRTNPTNGLTTIRMVRQAWDHPLHSKIAHRALEAYGPDYRLMVQSAVWGALLRRHTRLAATGLREGITLLPRWRDRAYTLVPPQISAKVGRLWRSTQTPSSTRGLDGAS